MLESHHIIFQKDVLANKYSLNKRLYGEVLKAKDHKTKGSGNERKQAAKN